MLPDRYRPVKTPEKLLCGHPYTEENSVSVKSLEGQVSVKCLTCKSGQVYTPGHWRKMKFKPEQSTDTVNTTESTASTETVEIVG